MAYTSWRGVIGLIKPTMRPGSTEEMIKLLPEGIGVIPLFLNVRRGAREEFQAAIKAYEPLIQQLAEQECDIILPEGAGPFVILGFEGERDLVRKWEKKYGRPMVTSSTSQVNSMKALGIKKPLVVSYATGVTDKDRDTYFTKAGFKVAGQPVIPLPDFEKAGQISAHEVYAYIKKEALRMPKADGMVMRGSGWRSLETVEWLEQDLGIPVVHAVTARIWEVQKRLNVNQKLTGFGRLLAEMPDYDFD